MALLFNIGSVRLTNVARHVPPPGEWKRHMFYEIAATDGSTYRCVRCRLPRRDSEYARMARPFDHSKVFLSFLAMHCNNTMWMFYMNII